MRRGLAHPPSHSKQSKYAEALDWHEKARLIREDKAPNSLDAATTYNNIGNVYSRPSKYAEALDWHEKARLIKEEKAPNRRHG